MSRSVGGHEYIHAPPFQVASLPELPDAAQQRLGAAYGLSPADAAALVGEDGAVAFFEAAVLAAGDALAAGRLPEGAPEQPLLLMRGVAKAAANWILNDLLGQLARLGPAAPPADPGQDSSQSRPPPPPAGSSSSSSTMPAPAPAGRGAALATCGLAPAALGELVACVLSGHVSGRAAKDVLSELLADTRGRGEGGQARSPRAIIAEKGWAQLNDAASIRALCAATAADPALAPMLRKYRAGNERVLGAFVARAIEASGGVANPALVSQLMAEALRLPS